MGNQSVKSKDSSNAVLEETPKPKVTYTEEELRQRLTEEEFNITQNKGTEKAWTGKSVQRIVEVIDLHSIIKVLVVFKRPNISRQLRTVTHRGVVLPSPNCLWLLFQVCQCDGGWRFPLRSLWSGAFPNREEV